MSKQRASAFGSLLDELMGKERDVPADLRTNRVMQFHDDEIDKFWLCGLSPYLLFKNTRSDLGPWDKIQDDKCKEEWDALPQEKKDEYGYEYDLMTRLSGMVYDLDKTIKRNQDKLMQENAYGKIQLSKETLAVIDGINAEVKELQAQSQAAGENGDVDASMAFDKQTEALLAKKTSLENPEFPGKEKVMDVCEICCNFMSNTDSDIRKAEHLAGKQHMGWALIRDKLAELKAMNDGKGPNPKKMGSSSSAAPVDAPDSSRDRDKDREKERERERGRDERDRGDRYRDDRGRDERGRDNYRDQRKGDYRDSYRDSRDSRDYRDQRRDSGGGGGGYRGRY